MRKTQKATHALESNAELLRKIFGPLSSLAKNDPADWWEVEWNVYLYYLCNVGAGRKTHHIQQFCLAITILVWQQLLSVSCAWCFLKRHYWNSHVLELAFCPEYDPTFKFERLSEKTFSSFLACRREILKLVKYCERKYGNSAFTSAFFSLFFFIPGQSRWFSRKSNDTKSHQREQR